jgi:hypothetical protein
MTAETAPAKPAGGYRGLVIPVLIGCLVSVALGVYGGIHKGNSVVIDIRGFPQLALVKSWLASIATALAVVQVISAMIMYGRIKAIPAPSWIGALHRWSGRIAFFTLVPVAVFCLYGLGFLTFDTREVVHSVLGCVFFGIFTIKMLVLTKPGIAGWILPVLGGLVFAVLVVLWVTSAYWYFTTQ